MNGNISKHLDKNNMHHAYLIEGEREEIITDILAFLNDAGVNTGSNNPDFIQIALDSFKVEDARNLKAFGSERGFSDAKNAKKIFIISANSFLLEAQNTLLKMFEEPIENTHFFLVVPDVNSLLKTLVSRFYLIKASQGAEQVGEAEKFIRMPISKRLEFLKELLAEEDEEDEEGNEIVVLNSTRAKALKFLNALESVLHIRISKGIVDIGFFEHFFKVRKFLRMPGSSAKTLMESVALVIPNFEN